ECAPKFVLGLAGLGRTTRVGRPAPATPWASSRQSLKGMGSALEEPDEPRRPLFSLRRSSAPSLAAWKAVRLLTAKAQRSRSPRSAPPSDPSLSPYVWRRDGGSGSRGRRPAHRRRASVVCPCKRGSFPQRPSRSRRAWSAAAGRHVERVPFSGRIAAAALGALDDPRSPCAQNIIKWRQPQRRAVARRTGIEWNRMQLSEKPETRNNASENGVQTRAIGERDCAVLGGDQRRYE